MICPCNNAWGRDRNGGRRRCGRGNRNRLQHFELAGHAECVMVALTMETVCPAVMLREFSCRSPDPTPHVRPWHHTVPALSFMRARAAVPPFAAELSDFDAPA